jgi:FAD-linked oxidoreductase
MKDDTPVSPPTADGLDWTNWSRSVGCRPDRYETPREQDTLQQLIKTTSGPLRVHGAGHSFMPVASTTGTLIGLQNMAGGLLGQHHTDKGPVACLQAGATLNALSRGMQASGLAFKNLGDIDVQSLAGATQTATHGTGKSFPCLSGEIEGLTLLTAQGDVIRADRATNSDLLLAARASLGALGIVLDADVAVRSAFKLHRHATMVPLRDVLAEAQELWDTHRHFEFFALPFCDYVVKVVHDETDQPDRHDNPSDDDMLLKALRALRTLTKRAPKTRRRIMNGIARTVKPETQIGWSWELLASERNVRFHEMEYHLPMDRGLKVLDEVLQVIERDQPDVYFPLECRMTAPDDSWLSPFSGAPRISVAVHTGYKDDYRWMFEKVEPIFLRNGGRPHWGKLHSLNAAHLKTMYPRFEAFQAMRAELDPAGRFLNDHLSQLFDAVAR